MVGQGMMDGRNGRRIRKRAENQRPRLVHRIHISVYVSIVTSWSTIRLTPPGGGGSSRGILGTEGRNGVMCDPATVGTASVSQVLA
jgi:hypothetical protein